MPFNITVEDDVEQFVAGLPAVRAHLFRRHRAVIAECDGRLVEGIDLPASLTIRREFPRLYRSERLEPREVPNLYSEIMLLNLE